MSTSDYPAQTTPESGRESHTRRLPVGTVTLVFTDIEGSSDLWEKHGVGFKVVLDEHNRLMREAAGRWQGAEVKTEGDAFFLSFASAETAVQFAVEAQLAFARQEWPAVLPGVEEIRVRIGMHTGEPIVGTHPDGTEDYFGPVVNRAARVGAAGHGQQVILSETTYQTARMALPSEIAFADLGEHRLKGVGEEHLWQVAHPELRREFPALKTMNVVRHNLPLQMTSFVGRERETEELRELLTGCRLLTLTGPGGTGKTRLGLRVAEEVVDGFRNGVYFVPLESVLDPDLVSSAVAGALGLSEERGRPLLETIQDYLKDKQLLLMLDNFEHLLPAAPVVARLLGACPGLKVLATSRSVLQVHGEQQYAVLPLALPDSKRLPPVESLASYEAIGLFLQRARAARPSFVISEENGAAIAGICERLDGLPLAIELAAARVKLLPPQALLSRLSSRLNLLTGGGRDRTSRQQTLRGAIGWSHDLLEEEERTLFRRLSVFLGGCTLEAAEKVCIGITSGSDTGAQALDLDILTGIGSLVDKSLLVQEETGGGPRFRMLETIREFALERLQESGEAGDLYEAYASCYLEFAQEAAPGMMGPDQAATLDSLEREHDNFRAALGWALGRLTSQAPTAMTVGEASGELAVRLSALLSPFWYTRGHWREGTEWLEAALEAAPEAAPAERARSLLRAGILRTITGEYTAARSHFEASLEIQRELGDRQGVASLLNNLGLVAWRQGALDAARSLYEESLGIQRELQDREGTAASLNNLGNLASAQGDYAGARSLFEESLGIQKALGDRHGIANALLSLGNAAMGLGESAIARSLYEESLAIQRDLGDRKGTAASLNNLGILAGTRQEYELAQSLYEESLGIRTDLGDRPGISGSLEAVASLCAETERWHRACILFAAAETLRQEIGSALDPAECLEHEEFLARTRTGLGAEAFAAAWEEGCAMSLEQAIGYALRGGVGA